MGCLVVNANLIQSALSITASSAYSPMICDVAVKDMLLKEKVKCSLVCSINRDERYVIVSPDVVWLPQDWGVDGEFTVYSNVDWIIE